MKNFMKLTISLIIVMSIVGCSDDNQSKQDKHLNYYNDDKANIIKFKSKCLSDGDERSCRIYTYSIDQVRRYESTYGRR